jgi:hypothetical protein
MNNHLAFPPAPLSFPSECSLLIFSFLDLRDLLSFGSASLLTMKEALPDLRRRRNRMKETFAYCRDWKISTGFDRQKIGLWNEVEARYPDMNWVPIPTVQERVDQLCKRMPSSHPCYDMLVDLCHELYADSNEEKLVQCRVVFSSVFFLWQGILRAPKLHAGILASVIHSKPLAHDEDRTTSLDQYVGDVLCMTYLFNQSILRLVEGGPTNTTFTDVLRHHRAHDESSCYKSWVYMHSFILRVKHFTRAQRDRLGIPDFFAVSEMIPNDCYMREPFISSEMALVFDEFGPLGPAFRGRDLVRVRVIKARRLFAFLITNDNLGETTRDTLEWLCLVHEQARKARPMTVRAPMVRLCCPPMVE